MKTRISGKVQSGGFLNKLLGQFLKVGLPLAKIGAIPLVKSVLMPLKLTGAGSATDSGIHQKKILGWAKTTQTNNFKWRNGRYHENS